jgi:hypothetical protein
MADVEAALRKGGWKVEAPRMVRAVQATSSWPLGRRPGCTICAKTNNLRPALEPIGYIPPAQIGHSRCKRNAEVSHVSQ